MKVRGGEDEGQGRGTHTHTHTHTSVLHIETRKRG